MSKRLREYALLFGLWLGWLWLAVRVSGGVPGSGWGAAIFFLEACVFVPAAACAALWSVWLFRRDRDHRQLLVRGLACLTLGVTIFIEMPLSSRVWRHTVDALCAAERPLIDRIRAEEARTGHAPASLDELDGGPLATLPDRVLRQYGRSLATEGSREAWELRLAVRNFSFPGSNWTYLVIRGDGTYDQSHCSPLGTWALCNKHLPPLGAPDAK